MIRAFLNPVTLLLATICLQWAYLAELGPFTVIVPYLTLALVGIFAGFSPTRLRAASSLVRDNLIWLFPFATYLIMSSLILFGSAGANVSPRQIFYLVCSIGLGAFVATMHRAGRVLRLGAAAGIIVLIAAIEVLARRIGLSWTDAISEFFGRGDLQFVMYRFLTPIFNSVAPTSDVTYFNTATKNSVAGCVLVLGLLFRSGSAKPERDLIGVAFLGLVLTLLLVLNDRSVLISAVASIIIATVIGTAIRPGSNLYLLVLKLLGLVAAVVVGIGQALSDSALSGTLMDRFSFEDHSSAVRLEQYRGAIEKIAQHPILGNGYFEVEGYVIHNVFLNAWGYCGLIAFLLAAAFYVGMLGRWIHFMVAVIKQPQLWVLPLAVEWVAPLPFMPLFRVWLSGEGGVFKYAEWIAIGTFFGCLTANRLRSTQLRARKRSHSAQDRGYFQPARLSAVPARLQTNSAMWRVKA